MSDHQKSKTIKAVVSSRENNQSDYDLLDRTMGLVSGLIETHGEPFDISIKLSFADAELSLRVSRDINHTLNENLTKKPSEVFESPEFETEDHGNVKTSLDELSSLEITDVLVTRLTIFITDAAAKGCSATIKKLNKIKEIGDDLNDKFK